MKPIAFHAFHLLSGLWHRINRRFTPAGLFVLLGLFISAAVGLDTHSSLNYQIFVLLFTLCVGSTVWCLGATRFLKQQQQSKNPYRARRILPRFATAGIPVLYQIQIEHPSGPLPLHTAILENLPDPRPPKSDFIHTPLPGEIKQSFPDRFFGSYRWNKLLSRNRAIQIHEPILPQLTRKTRSSVPVTMLPMRRGVIHFSGMTLAQPDLFGLVHSHLHLPLPQSMLILPKRYALPNLPLPGRREYQRGGVSLASNIGESDEFVSLRDYRPGDPLRHLHWKSWAKTGRPVVKEYQDEYFVRHALILDTYLGHRNEELFEEAISVTSSFACHIQSQESLLDLMFVGSEAYCFTAGRSVSYAEKMLEILASISPCTQNPFETLKHLVLRHLAEVSGCVCVFLDWDQPRQDLVRLMEHRHIPVQVFVIQEAASAAQPDYHQESENIAIHVLKLESIQQDLLNLK